MGCGNSAPVAAKGEEKPEEPAVVVKVLTPLEITRKIHTAIRWNKNFEEIQELLEPEGAVDIVELLIKKKCNINASNMKGNTALHMAIGYDYYAAAKVLLANGADNNATNVAQFPASKGLEGDKSMAGAAIVCAATVDEFMDALKLIKDTLPRGMTKETFIKTGLRMKKAHPDLWVSNKVQAEFTALLHNWEPEG